MRRRDIAFNAENEEEKELIADMISLHHPEENAVLIIEELGSKWKRNLKARDETAKKDIKAYFRQNTFIRYLAAYFQDLVNNCMPEKSDLTQGFMNEMNGF